MLPSISTELYPYVYSFGGVLLGIIVLIIYWRRPDFRKLIIATSIILFPLATLAENLFFQDYWFPPDFIDFYIGNIRIISGDIILALVIPPLFITGIPFLLNLKIKNLEKVNLRKLVIKLFVLQIITATIFAMLFYLTDLNSIFCGVISTLFIVTPILIVRRDLIKLYLFTAITFGISAFIFYLLYQLVIGDDYLQSVWLLDHSIYSVTVLGVKVPLTEILFGAFAAPFYLLLVLFSEPNLELRKQI